MRKLFTELPTPHSHVFWFNWGPTKPFPMDMALSMQGEVFLGAYSLWQDPGARCRNGNVASEKMLELDDISVGGQMNDENMLHHPQNYYTPEVYAKLETLRVKYDPDRRFASWVGTPYKTTLLIDKGPHGCNKKDAGVCWQSTRPLH